MIKKALLLLTLAVPVLAVEDSTPVQMISPFGTLNNQDDPMVLPDNTAQDLLNVEITDQGRSVRKRRGLGLAYTLPVTTSPVHGIYSFYNTAGNDVSLFFNDHHMTSSVNGTALVTLFSTGTKDATWQCTDNLGYAYCASSAREPTIKTDGSTYSPVVMVDTGTMVASTAQRLVVAGISGYPNQLDFSAANNFTNWTLGSLDSSPYNETISAPGSRITHITYACGGLIWFKDTSFGILLNPDSTYNAQNIVLAPEIGTLDNTSVVYPGGIQFRAQDGHIYNYDCSGIEKLTRDITPTINGSSSRRSNSWTVTTQSDFQLGSSSPTNPSQSLSFTISPGSVVPGSFTVTENTSAQWNSGTASNVSVWTSSISLSTNNSGTATNPSFESSLSGNWTDSGSNFSRVSSIAGDCTVNPQNGSFFAQATTTNNNVSATGSFQIVDLNGVVLAQTSLSGPTDCNWTQYTATLPNQYVGTRGKFRLYFVQASEYLTTSDSYILGGNASIYLSGTSKLISGSRQYWISFDNIQNGSSTITTGSFTSQAINSNLPYGFVFTSATWNTNASTPSFVIQHSSSSTGSWYEIGQSTNTNLQASKQYLRYISTFTLTASDTAIPSITGVQLIERSSGTYFSAVHNAPNLTSWDTFTKTDSVGGGSHTYYIRASSYPFVTLGSSPSWTSQTAGGVVTASTGSAGAYFQVIDSFTITSATDTAPTLNDFTVNWFEGSSSDKPYGIYFGKDNAIWWSVASGAGQSTNNRILRYDLINKGWVLYDIPSNGFLIRNQNLYIGSAAGGYIYKYGDVDSDNGSAINAYWKSKDFPMNNPMVDKEFRTLSLIAKSVQNSSMTVTYTVNATSSTPYTLSLYNSASSILRNNRMLPTGTVGNTFNVQFGNNAIDQYFEVFGLAYKYVAKPWIVGN